MNTTDPRLIARDIRRTLRIHERTNRAAIRLPDPVAALVADVLEHYAATSSEVQHHEIYDRDAVLWMVAAQHVARLFTLTERQAVHTVEAASDALGIIPAWMYTTKPPYEGKYLCFTGPQLRRIVRYLQKRADQ